MIDNIICFFVCAKVITTQVTRIEPPKTEVVQNEEPQSKSPQKGAKIQKPSTLVGRIAIEDRVCTVFKENCQAVLTVFTCESALQSQAISKTNDYGIAQINLKAHYRNIKGITREEKISNLLDVNYNLAFAFNLYQRQGFVPWRSSQHCHGLV